MILHIAKQVSTINNDIPCGCSRRCSTGRVIAGGHESIAALMYVTLIGVLMFWAMGALVTLSRFGISRLNRIRFLRVVFLIVELVELMRARVASFTIGREFKRDRNRENTVPDIDIRKRVLRFHVANNIVHGRRKRHK